MRELLKFELGKILGKKLSWVCLFLLAALSLTMWMGGTMVVTRDGQELEGRASAAYSRERSALYGKTLTAEKAFAIMTEEGPKITEENEEYAEYYGLPLRNAVHNLLTEAEEKAVGTKEWEMPDTEALLENKEAYCREADKILESFQESGLELTIGDSSGWENMMYLMMNLMIFAGAFGVILLAGSFSEEYSRGTDALILTARYGRKKIAAVKLLAGFLVSALLFFVPFAVLFVRMATGYGLDGWDVSLQVSAIGAYEGISLPLNYLQALLLEIGLWLAAMLAMGGLTMLISSRCHSSFLAVVISMALYFSPAIFSNALPAGVLALMPIIMFTTTPLELPGLRIAGAELPGFIWCFAAVVLILGASWYLGRRAFARHQVQ